MTKSWQLILIVFAVLISYTNIFTNKLIIDDQYFISDWSLTREWSNVGQLLMGANPQSQPGVYRPIRSILYLVYYHLWGTNPVGYHIHSFLVHLISTILIYFIVKILISNLKFQISNSNWIPFVTSLLFGLHPIHTESITYIAASMEMTGVIFFLSAFLTYLHKKYNWTIVFAILAFFTYEMTLTLPLLLLLYEFILGKKNIKKIWPTVAVVAGYLFIRIGVLHISPARGDYLAFSFYHTQLTMTKMWIKYLWLLIWPVNLSHNQTIVPGFEAFMTPYSDQKAILSQTILDLPILLCITFISTLVFIAVKVKKNYPIISFSIGWFFISLLPVAYFLPQGTAFAEKYLYIASFAFVLILALGLDHLKKLGVVAIILIATFYSLKTYTRNQNWQSPQTLWEHEVQIHPTSELAYYNLGIIYTQNGDKDKAIMAYKNVLQLKPEFWQAQHNLENLLK